MRLMLKRRRGVTLLDVALAAVVLTVGMLFTSRYFGTVFEDLSPRGQTNGLRRYLLAEEMLRAQAEGLRAMRLIPVTEEQCKLVNEPPGMNYRLQLSRSAGPSVNSEQLYYYSIAVDQNGQRIGSLTMSTLRAIGPLEGQDEKIGL